MVPRLSRREVLDTVLRDNKLSLAPDACRMIVVTRGAPLAHRVGRRFSNGDAVLRGLKLNEPCSWLEEVVGRPVVKALIHRCGFAEILVGERIHDGE